MADFAPIELSGGVFADDTPAASKGMVIYADKFRFRSANGKPFAELIGGWEDAIGYNMTGVPRAMIASADLLGSKYIVVATHQKLQLWSGGVLVDATPFDAIRVVGPTALATTNGSAVVVVTDVAHGRDDQSFVSISNASTVNGITLSGVYRLTKLTADTYSITASSNANATGTGGGYPVLSYQIAPGTVDSIGGLGYSTGGYSTGGYSVPGSFSLFARTWTLDQWGQFVVANPRGGSVYMLQPNLTATELNADPTFGTSASWTKGAGWSIASNTATATAGSASDLSISVNVTVGGFYRLTFTCTRSAGTFQPKLGTQSVGSSINASGTYSVTFLVTGTGSLIFSKDATFAGTLTLASLKIEPVAYQIQNIMTQVDCIWVTPQKHLVMGGTQKVSDSTYQPLTVRWTDQANETVVTPLATNQAGDFQLAEGSRIIRGVPFGNQSLIFTDSAVYGMNYLVNSPLVFGFPLIATGCGLIGPQAVAVKNGVAYWMGNNGQFYALQGGTAQAIPCSVREYVFKNIDPIQGYKTACYFNSRKNEVTWYYVDQRDVTNECSRYVSLDVQSGFWSIGILARTAACDAGVMQFPMAADPSGTVWFHEKGGSAGISPLVGTLQVAPYDVSNGKGVMQIFGFMPDLKDFTGSGTITFQRRQFPQSPVLTSGPYSFTPTTTKVNFRTASNYVGFTLTISGYPALARFGSHRFEMKPTKAAR